MAPKLGELLIKEGVITPKQLDEALKSQVIFGGRLGTNLVEMGLIDEEKLVQYLSRQLEVPYASPDQLMSVPPDVIKLISPEMAEEYKMIPLSLDKKRLTIAIWDPSDLSAIDAISFITGYIIKPLVCSEMRLLTALEKYYGVKRALRYIQLQGGTGIRSREAGTAPPKPAPEPQQVETSPFESLAGELLQGSPAEPAVEQPAWGDLVEIQPVETVRAPPPKTAIPEGRQAILPVEEPDVVDLVKTQPADRPVAPPVAKVEPAPAAAKPAEAQTPTIDALLAKLAEARGRDTVADALIAYLGHDYQRVALFMIKGRVAAGWKGVSRATAIAGFENFQIPLDDASLLKVVTDTKNFYLGPILDTPGNTKLITGLAGERLDSALLIPLIMMERVVTVLYVEGEKGLLGKRLFELQKLAGKVALAFEILILKNKILLA
ncbi:MAG TPA: hypothetical protein VK187_14710 [Geobacteraceae bacterium]|nr:hypothetical protein [Geobacteraceae bacterium]